MKVRITHKELVLILGIVVAMLVAITLWIAHPAEQPDNHATLLPNLTNPFAAKSIIYRMAEVIF